MNTRILTLVLGIAIAVPVFAPVAEAQSQLNVKSVGEIFVDATGRASGQNLNGLIVEASGLVTSYTSAALNTKMFDSVAIDGFTQAEKIQGVGSSEIVLRGSNAVVSMTDTIHGTLRIQATSDTSVNWRLAKGIRASFVGDARHHADLLAESGAYLGSLVVTGASGEASSKSALATGVTGEITARLEKGSQVVFHARPVYVDGRAWSDALAHALAEGQLAANVVTESSGSAERKSETNFFSTTHASTDVAAAGSVTTDVQSRAQAAVVVAYDLAYETLTARSASDIAVYADGRLAKRVATAADVGAAAEAGLAAYYAMTSGGRSQVLASTPDFSKTATHRLTVSAAGAAAAASESQAASQSAARSASAVHGALAYHANGKLTGDFFSGIVNRDDASVHDWTTMDTKTEVLKSFRVVGDTFTEAAARGHTAVFTGAKANVYMVDDVYTTVVVEAKQAAQVDFDLGANVKAAAEGTGIMRLSGPHGYAGAMVITTAAAEATATSRFVTSAEGHVLAHLDTHARLIFRSETELTARADASAEVIVRAIADGRLAGHVLAGYQDGATVASDVEYYANVALEAAAKARGSYDVGLRSTTAASFLFEARGGAAFAAKTASDVQVFVNGRAATAVAVPEAALMVSDSAKYWVGTMVDGTVRVLVNAGASAKSNADVSIQSTLESSAQARANTDAFGTFKMFADGLAVGSFVSLKTDQRAGIVHDFRMISTGTQVFQSIAAGASAFASAGAEGSSTLLLENRETKLEFSDTTSAYMKVVAKADAEVRYRLASGMEAAAHSRSVVELTSTSGAYLGSMIVTDAEGKAAADSRFATDAAGEIVAHLQAGAQIIFKTHVGIETELTAAERALVNQAIAAGHVGGQIFVQTQASLSAAAHAALAAQAAAEGASNTVLASAAEARGHVTAAITANYYQDVQIVTAAIQNRVDITVSSTLTTGKTIIVSLDRNTVSGMLTGEAEILIDGHAATQANSYGDVLNPNDDGGVYEYFVLAGEAGTQVLVSIPHFSTHVVTLKAREPSSPPIFMYATIFLGVLVAAETVILVRRRWT